MKKIGIVAGIVAASAANLAVAFGTGAEVEQRAGAGIVTAATEEERFWANDLRIFPSALIFYDVTVFPNGRVQIKEGVTLDEASAAFWASVQQMGMRLACELK